MVDKKSSAKVDSFFTLLYTFYGPVLFTSLHISNALVRETGGLQDFQFGVVKPNLGRLAGFLI